jgi:hypothetical protein
VLLTQRVEKMSGRGNSEIFDLVELASLTQSEHHTLPVSPFSLCVYCLPIHRDTQIYQESYPEQ